jgi:hypothetical protein
MNLQGLLTILGSLLEHCSGDLKVGFFEALSMPCKYIF